MGFQFQREKYLSRLLFLYFCSPWKKYFTLNAEDYLSIFNTGMANTIKHNAIYIVFQEFGLYTEKFGATVKFRVGEQIEQAILS